MFGLGWPELIVILAILLLIFGASRLPKLSRSAGESVSQFKKGLGDDNSKDNTQNQKNGSNKNNKTSSR